MKLVEILARELKEWPQGCVVLVQESDKEIYIGTEILRFSGTLTWRGVGVYFTPNRYAEELADDWNHAQVTRAQWEAERARIAANQQATQEAREIARTGSMTSEEQELADIACGKRSKEDQELWDNVAVAVIGGVVSSDAFHNYPNFQGDPEVGAVFASQMADAFMAERAKRMKG